MPPSQPAAPTPSPASYQVPSASGFYQQVGSAPLQDCLVQVIQVLIGQLERGRGWRDGHSAEVARLVGMMADNAGIQGESTLHIKVAALVHELGKPFEAHTTLVGLELNPSLAASAAELLQAPVGLLAPAQLPLEVMKILTAIYERHDGRGVPGRAAGNDVPFGAKLIAAAEAFLDLIGNPEAPGGKAGDPQTALQRVRDVGSRGAFDPVVVDHLARVATEARSGGPMVLVIDEDVRSSAVLEGTLKAAGYDVITANTTGDAALVLLGENVQLVLSEVNLRPMDGFTFLQWLRNNQRTRDIPFMFVSQAADAENVNRGFELGALDYIVKPFRPEVVVAKIKRIIK
jgi:response regulator RpfG family c-di-GMP phosphodiesterase